MIIKHLVALALAGSLLVATARSSSSSVSVNATDWQFQFSTGMPSNPSPLQGMVGWFFDVPHASSASWNASDPSVHYLTVPYTAPMTGKASVSMTFQIQADPGVVYQYPGAYGQSCCAPPPDALVTLFLWHAHDNHFNDYYRWWAQTPFELASAGVDPVTITVPLDPCQWTAVYHTGCSSQTAMDDFASTLARPGYVGMTFGGNGGFGHGLNVWGGTARFILTNYSIQ